MVALGLSMWSRLLLLKVCVKVPYVWNGTLQNLCVVVNEDDIESSRVLDCVSEFSVKPGGDGCFAVADSVLDSEEEWDDGSCEGSSS